MHDCDMAISNLRVQLNACRQALAIERSQVSRTGKSVDPRLIEPDVDETTDLIRSAMMSAEAWIATSQAVAPLELLGGDVVSRFLETLAVDECPTAIKRFVGTHGQKRRAATEPSSGAQVRSRRFDRLPNAGDLVGGEDVPDDRVARFERAPDAVIRRPEQLG